MVLAVVRDPADDVALNGELTEDRERIANSAIGLERAVCKQPVVAHRDSDARKNVADEQNRELDRPDHPIPEKDDRDDEPGGRQRDADEVGEFAPTSHRQAMVR